MRHASLGAVFLGNMDRIICNKRASVVWEAAGLITRRVQTNFCIQIELMHRIIEPGYWYV